jgi:cytoskeletal protein CcmA (bactofilin family)
VLHATIVQYARGHESSAIAVGPARLLQVWSVGSRPSQFRAQGLLGSDEGGTMVFKKDSKLDAFQRQIGALRQQLGPNPDESARQGDSQQPYADEPIDVQGDDQNASQYNYAASAGNANQGTDVPSAYGTYPSTDSAEEQFDDMSTPAMPVPPAIPMTDAQTSVVAHDTTWKGDLVSEGTIHIHGRVEGTIKAKQDVFIAEEADVDATITATNVVIAGFVKGGIRCGNRFEVLPQGRVDGEIQAPTLVVHDGASIIGQFRMGAGEGTETAKTSVIQRRATRGTA